MDEMDIERVLAAQVEAWNRHDARAFAMAFAEDADFTNVVGESAHGRAAIEAFHAPMFATIFRDTEMKIAQAKTRFIRPDVAAVDVWWEMTGLKGRDGQAIPPRRGLMMLVMTQEGERWLVSVMHNMDLPAA